MYVSNISWDQVTVCMYAHGTLAGVEMIAIEIKLTCHC